MIFKLFTILILGTAVANSAIISVSLRTTVESTTGVQAPGKTVLESYDITVTQPYLFFTNWELKGNEIVEHGVPGYSLIADFNNDNKLDLFGIDNIYGLETVMIEIFDIVTDDGQVLSGITLYGTSTAVQQIIPANGLTHSVSFVEGGILDDLGNPVDGWVISYTGIDLLMNESTQRDTYTLEFSPAPIPEPSSLLLVGLSSLAFMRRSRKCA